MSSTKTPKREGLDAYYTPDAVAKACLSVLDIAPSMTVWEPHVGGGAFMRALADRGVYTVASDINPNAPGLVLSRCRFVGDFLSYIDDGGHEFDWIVGNPPFNDAEAHVRQALRLTSGGVGFLLRLAFLASAKRAALFREHPLAEVHVLTSRPSFTGGGTDSADYGFFVWRRDYKGSTTLHHLDWRS